MIQVAAVVAVQPQPAAAVTPRLAGPPAAGVATSLGETLSTVQAPDCATVTVWPATVSVPVRLDVDVFAATV